ncbi:MAG: pyridoxal phosphate-dependent aminotransferase [Phycisphaerae bacterium]|nr:pyridoxal phosphate-dependent aminotransferase [Phycisphaerae bacterium]
MRSCERMQQVQTPIIPIVGQWIRQHPGTLSLGQGMVGYGPPSQIQEQLNGFFERKEVHEYQAVSGMAPLREAIRKKLHQENGIDLPPDDAQGDLSLCVTAGANMAFMNAVLAVTDPGDEILLLRPFYFNHEMAVHMAGCTPMAVDTDDVYQPTVSCIAERITERTRAIVTISPNNPTGAVYPEALLRQINTLCCERKLYHIHDETYEYFTFDGAVHFSPASMAGSAAHTISLFSLSKAYGFAGWRIGYMVFPSHLEESIKKIQDTLLICPPIISQVAALGALQAGRGYCEQHLPALSETRDIVWRGLQQIRELCESPMTQGAFYYLLKIRTPLSGMELTRRLIQEFKVAVIPGETFGLTRGCHLRLSYGPLDRDTAAQGVGRLVRGLQQLATSH